MPPGGVGVHGDGPGRTASDLPGTDADL